MTTYKKVNTIYHPSEIIQKKLGAPLSYIKTCIDKLYEIGDESGGKTNIKGIMTNYHIWEKYPIFNKLIKNIYLSIINDPINERYFPNSNKGFYPKITQCWGAIYQKGHYTLPHIHLPSIYSFVYYLQADGNDVSRLKFSEFEIKPRQDLLVGFPAWLEHEVPISTIDNDRIILAGNISSFSRNYSFINSNPWINLHQFKKIPGIDLI